jgi:predicted protein tyrosine phosphatase
MTKKILFVCNSNLNRSPTAEEIFKTDKKLSVRSAGFWKGSRNVLTEELLDWADIVFVMEKSQREEIERRFPKHFRSKFIISLRIPDIYNFMDPELVHLIKERTKGYF